MVGSFVSPSVTCEDRELNNPDCDRTLQALLKTFLDILLLRKGPESLPHSPFLFGAMLLLSLGVSALATAVLAPGENPRHDLTLLINGIGLAYFFVLLLLTGRLSRFIQTGTALLGVDFLLTAFVVVFSVFVGAVTDPRSALILAVLISLWSVPVQGHIISKAIDCNWIIGFALALSVFIMLQIIYRQLDGAN